MTFVSIQADGPEINPITHTHFNVPFILHDPALHPLSAANDAITVAWICMRVHIVLLADQQHHRQPAITSLRKIEVTHKFSVELSGL